ARMPGGASGGTSPPPASEHTAGGLVPQTRRAAQAQIDRAGEEDEVATSSPERRTCGTAGDRPARGRLVRGSGPTCGLLWSESCALEDDRCVAGRAYMSP